MKGWVVVNLAPPASIKKPLLLIALTLLSERFLPPNSSILVGDFCLAYLFFQSRQPVPGIQYLSGTWGSVVPEVREYMNHSLENIVGCPNLADVK
jgi:hypothetical protein